MSMPLLCHGFSLIRKTEKLLLLIKVIQVIVSHGSLNICNVTEEACLPVHFRIILKMTSYFEQYGEPFPGKIYI